MSLEPTPEEIQQLKLKKAESAKFEAVIDDLYLIHCFFQKHNEIKDEVSEALKELDSEVGILDTNDPDAVNLIRRFLKEVWDETDPTEKLYWMEFRNEWRKKVYEDYELRQLLFELWNTKNVREFAERLKVTYQTAYYKILPKINEALKESKFKFREVKSYDLFDMLKMLDKDHF